MTEDIQQPRRIAFGDKWLALSDHHVEPVSADICTEARLFHETICLGFGSIEWDANNDPVVTVNARLRLSIASATDLRNMIDGMLKGIVVTKEGAN